MKITSLTAAYSLNSTLYLAKKVLKTIIINQLKDGMVIDRTKEND